MDDTRIERAREAALSGVERSDDAESQGCLVAAGAIARNSLLQIEDILSEPEPAPSAEVRPGYRSVDEVAEKLSAEIGSEHMQEGRRRIADALEPSAEESGDRVLLWDMVEQCYVTCDERGQFCNTGDYRKATCWLRSTAERWPPHRYASADLSGWVESWGEQPVGDETLVEAWFREPDGVVGDSDADEAYRFYWPLDGDDCDITHFRLPLPSEAVEFNSGLSSKMVSREDLESVFGAPATSDGLPVNASCEPLTFSVRHFGMGTDDKCFPRGVDTLTEARVRRIVREELARDHRATVPESYWPGNDRIVLSRRNLRAIHLARADELDSEGEG